MNFEGAYILNPNTQREQRVKNRIVADGAQAFLNQLFRATALPGSFWLGLTGAVYEFDTATLANIAADEPSVAGGYARQELVRNGTDWNLGSINGFWRIRSKTLTWTPTADWSKAWSKMFLCDVETGTAGVVYSLSAPTPKQQLTKEGDADISLNYEFWMRG